MNKRVQSCPLIEDTELALPNVTTTMTSFTNLYSHKNDCSSFMHTNQQIPSSSLEGFHQHISLLNDTIESQESISSNDSQSSSISFEATSTPCPALNNLPTRRIANIIRSDLCSIKSFHQEPNIKRNGINLKAINISNIEKDENNDLLMNSKE
ncbi:unnamed protein product [Rotaria magnacalcarata]|nr:unnamed protein product [Rotaria magnacalcarata]